jgi:hypothetical protein
MLQSVSRTEGVVGLNVLVEVNAAVRELAELSSLLDLCGAKVLSAIRNLVHLAYVLSESILLFRSHPFLASRISSCVHPSITSVPTFHGLTLFIGE